MWVYVLKKYIYIILLLNIGPCIHYTAIFIPDLRESVHFFFFKKSTNREKRGKLVYFFLHVIGNHNLDVNVDLYRASRKTRKCTTGRTIVWVKTNVAFSTIRFWTKRRIFNCGFTCVSFFVLRFSIFKVKFRCNFKTNIAKRVQLSPVVNFNITRT